VTYQLSARLRTIGARRLAQPPPAGYTPRGPLPERSLSLCTPRTPGGQGLVVGCSHPGIETNWQRSAGNERPVQLLVGGPHLATAPEAEIDRVATSLRDK
jgi:7,8-dihydropterin-6-yl-methyl-4-(beta-D-ribofuranosyl)aminobenzene 5'-phosphate synthase